MTTIAALPRSLPTTLPPRSTQPPTTQQTNLSLAGNTSLPQFTCVPQRMEYLLAELIATSCSTPVNLFLVTSLFVYRYDAKLKVSNHQSNSHQLKNATNKYTDIEKRSATEKLRSQMVNIYAANIVAAITVSTILRCFDTVWSYYGFGPPSYISTGPATPSPFLKLWAFQKTTIVTTYIVIAWGIFLVILSIRSKAFRIHRTVAGVSDTEGSPSNGTKQQPHKSAFAKCFCWSTKSRTIKFNIFLSWFVPIVVSLIEVSIEKCSSDCKCSYNYMVQFDRVITCMKICSVVWAPITNHFLIVGCVIWVICAVLLISLLIRSQFQFNKVKKQMATSRLPTLQRHHAGEEQPTPFEIEQQRYDVNNPSRDEALHNSTGRSSFRHSNFLLISSLAQQLRWMRIISSVYVVGTGCMVGLTLYSILSEDYAIFAFPGRGPVPIFLIPTLSETFATVVLCTKLPNLRSAVNAMLTRIMSCKVVK